MILKLAYKNVFSRRSSIVIILFVAFAICLFCVANAVFDSTEQGVQATYVSSFTGDLIVRPSGNLQLSLFGDETPITGELTSLDRVIPYEDLKSYIEAQDEVQAVLGQVSGVAAIEYGSNRYATYVFGVDGKSYANAMSSIKIVEGEPFELGQKGVMLCKNAVEKLGVSLGQTVQFIVTDGPYVRIRAAPLTAIYEYEIYNSIFDRFAIADADTVRSLLDISDFTSSEQIDIDSENTTLLDQETDLDFDSLFDEAWDTEAIWDLEDESQTEETTDDLPSQILNEEYIPSTTWNFLIIRLANGADADKIIKRLNRHFKKNSWPVQATDWRHAAGSICLYLYWMRVILNIGISIVLCAGFIIVNNTLVINVLDRTQEIGTLRAIGTKKRYVSVECMLETFIMTISGGIIGVLLGKWLCHLITKANIVLHNSFLVQLFGSDALSLVLNGPTIFKMFLLVILLGIIGWIYPVIAAMKVSPVVAMQGGRS